MKPTPAQFHLLERLAGNIYGEMITYEVRTFNVAVRCQRNGWVKANIVPHAYYISITPAGRAVLEAQKS